LNLQGVISSCIDWRKQKTRTMTDHEKRKLQEELLYLRMLIDFHNGARETLWKGRTKELDEYIDSMLDYLNELREKLKNPDKNDQDKK
jgi:hypothetical protein